MQPPNVEGSSHPLNTPVQWERRGWTGVDRCRESSLPCSLIPRNYFLDFLKRITHPFCAYPRQLMVSAHGQHAISRAPSKYGGCINFDRHCTASSAPSSCCQLLELSRGLDEIFGRLGPQNFMNRHERDSCRLAVCHAALVSRAFSRHAFDKLRHTFDQIHPLLSLLPRSGYDESLDTCVSYWLEYS